MSLQVPRTRSRLALAVLVTAIAACGGRQPAEPPEETLRIQGSVTDKDTRLPIPGARVELYRFRWSDRISWFEKETLASSTTGEGGEYFLESRVTGCEASVTLTVYAEATGYGDDRESPRCTRATQVIDLVLVRYPPSP
jgi:hypothetical protein